MRKPGFRGVASNVVQRLESRCCTLKRAPQVVLGISVGVLLALAPLVAQRAPTATYDSDRKVKLAGVVTRMDWVNPSAFFFINVKDATGTVASWAVEVGNPLDLEKSGWTWNSLHIGDAVTVEGIPARSPARQALATSVVLTKTGTKLF